MKPESIKWLYTFFLLIVTIGWAVFTVMVIHNAMSAPSSASVLEASGTSVLLGALIGWNALVIQHWFRKNITEQKGRTPTQ